jgi:hypothetical protein
LSTSSTAASPALERAPPSTAGSQAPPLALARHLLHLWALGAFAAPAAARCVPPMLVLLLSTVLPAAAAAGISASSPFPDGAPRYWPQFGGTRHVRLLDGSWDYGFIDGWNSGFDSMSPAFKPSDATLGKKAAVPSCSDVVAGGAPGYLGPRGVAMYKTTFSMSAPAAPARLQFQSCSFYCRIWVNGQEVQPPLPAGASGPGHRAGGYVAFWVDVPSSLIKAGEGANELFVLADNRFNHTTAPMHTGGDFWHYGGLTRSVELHTLAPEVRPRSWAHACPPARPPVVVMMRRMTRFGMRLMMIPRRPQHGSHPRRAAAASACACAGQRRGVVACLRAAQRRRPDGGGR